MGTEGSGASRGGSSESFHNEDAFLVEDGLGLYVVCDGASGRPAGEIAAAIAIEALEQFIGGVGRELRSGGASTAVAGRGLRFAMDTVLAAARTDPALSGMSTTLTMLLVQGNRGVIGHVGDSRAYLIRRSRSYQLTLDHELTEALTNGGEPEDAVDAFAIELNTGDTVVLCTDGAEEVVQDPGIVRAAGDLSPQLLASRIVSAAQHRDDTLDATAVVVRVRGEREPGWLELSDLPQRVSFGHTLGLR